MILLNKFLLMTWYKFLDAMFYEFLFGAITKPGQDWDMWFCCTVIAFCNEVSFICYWVCCYAILQSCFLLVPTMLWFSFDMDCYCRSPDSFDYLYDYEERVTYGLKQMVRSWYGFSHSAILWSRSRSCIRWNKFCIWAIHNLLSLYKIIQEKIFQCFGEEISVRILSICLCIDI